MSSIPANPSNIMFWMRDENDLAIAGSFEEITSTLCHYLTQAGITLPGFGQTNDFWVTDPGAGIQTITAYPRRQPRHCEDNTSTAQQKHDCFLEHSFILHLRMFLGSRALFLHTESHPRNLTLIWNSLSYMQYPTPLPDEGLQAWLPRAIQAGNAEGGIVAATRESGGSCLIIDIRASAGHMRSKIYALAQAVSAMDDVHKPNFFPRAMILSANIAPQF